MKKLEVNQMENLQGGSSACFVAMATWAIALDKWSEEPSYQTSLALTAASVNMFDKCDQP